jgi:hypothetical protein
VVLVCGRRIESSARLIEWCAAVELFFPTTEFGIRQPAALWWSGDGWSLHQSAIDDSGTDLGIANQTLAQPGEGSLAVSAGLSRSQARESQGLLDSR